MTRAKRELAHEVRWAIARVVREPRRRSFLLSGGIDGVLALARFLLVILPLARARLTQIERAAVAIPDAELREQAAASLQHKAYHVAGATILATFLPAGAREHYIDVVAPLEAIYDFLDSLCDRHPETQEEAFRQLHLALGDALDPDGRVHDYYAFGPSGNDGCHLLTLVEDVRRALRRLDGYETLNPQFREAVTLYTDAQTFKHLEPSRRRQACIDWHARHRDRYGDLTWWEFGAACGSQFHVYAALYAVFCSRFDRIAQTYDAYFPSFAALHVLLDSFIDQAEDRAHGELNWVACYPSPRVFAQRAGDLAHRSARAFEALPMPRAHLFVLRIMCLFYLTHPKVYEQGMDAAAAGLLRDLSGAITDSG